MRSNTCLMFSESLIEIMRLLSLLRPFSKASLSISGGFSSQSSIKVGSSHRVVMVVRSYTFSSSDMEVSVFVLLSGAVDILSSLTFKSLKIGSFSCNFHFEGGGKL